MEKRGLFERVFGGKKEPSGHFEQFRLLNSWQTTFTPFSGKAWDVGTVRSAVDSFARNAAKLTARHIRRGDGTITNVNGHLDRLLQFQPNPYMTAYAFFYKVAADYKISNNAIIYKMYDNTGKITGFYPVNASAVELLEKNNVLYARLRFSTGKSYICEYTDLIHIRRHFHDNDIFGSRNGALMPVLETADKFNQSMSKFAELVAIIRGILKVQDSTKDADLKKRRDDFVRDNLMESNNGSGIIVTDRKYDYTNLDNKSTPIPQGQLAYETTYIYLKSDEINNKNIIVVSELEPDASDNDIVYLAEISADGIITDHRTYAVGKFIGYQNEYNCLKKQEITHSITAYNNIKVEQELQTKDIKFLILVSAYSVGIISFDEDYTRCTYRRNSSYSGNITNDTAGIYAGVTTKGGNQLKVQISKKEGTENVYNFLYKIYSGSSRSDNNYGTIGYTIYYV